MTFRNDPPTIPLETLVWDECGKEAAPRARLLTHIKIGSTDMHLEAWQVIEDENGCQMAVDDSYRADDLDDVSRMMDCSFTTTEIDGRTYVLIATPYGT